MRFFQRHRKQIIAVIALLLVAVLVLSLVISVIPTRASAASTQEEIDALKEQSSGLQSEMDELEDELDSLSGQVSDAMSEKSVVEQQINVLNEQISNTESIISQYDTVISQYESVIADYDTKIAAYDATIAEYDELIAQEQANLEAAEAAEEEHYDAYCQRVRALEEEGSVSYLEILFNASSFSDLLDRAMMVSEIVEYDTALGKALEQDRQDIADSEAAMESYQQEQITAREEQVNARAEQVAAKEEQESARSQQASALSDLSSQKSSLASKTSQIDSLLDELQTQQAEYESELDDLKNQNSAIDSEIAQKQAELEAQVSSGEVAAVVTQSDYAWPLPGHYTLSSLFGTRTDPFTGQPGNHRGIDIPAPYGTSILASRGGVVITSGYNSSYGNYVVISHGGSDSTLYGHMSSRAVSVGESVSQGQVIGYVGSTGRSTGNHLHFEVRVNGNRTDPINYFPGLTLYYQSGGKTVVLSH